MRLTLITIFIIIPLLGFSQNRIAGGEYWFDTDPATRQGISVAPASSLTYTSDIDISHLDEGLHVIHMRFYDDESAWTGAVSRFFVIKNLEGVVTTPVLTSLQYWFDSDYAGVETVDFPDASTVQFTEDIDVTGLQEGLHTVHFRWAVGGSWSSAVTRFFVVRAPEPGDSGTIEQVEYWFDSDYSSAATIGSGGTAVTLSELIDVSSLAPGLHTIGLRALSVNGGSSPVTTRFFVKRTDEPAAGNSITGYRYWINDTLTVTRLLDESAPSVLMIDSLDLRLYPKGEYMAHFQFRDSGGRWSGAVHDTLIKVSYPWATISAADLEACAGDTLNFTAGLVDADTVSWDFGDGFYSDEQSARHAWSSEGSYQVSLYAADRVDGTSSLTRLSPAVTVHANPVLTLADTLAIHDNESTTVDGGTGFTSWYWNETEGTSLYSADGSVLGLGIHYLTLRVVDQYGCTGSDTLVISVSVADGIEDIMPVRLKLYPNPVGDYLTIDWDIQEMSLPGLAVTDRNGRVLLTRNSVSPGERVDLMMLKPGNYIVVITIEGISRGVPIIKL